MASKRINLSVWTLEGENPHRNVMVNVPDELSAEELIIRLYKDAGVDDDGNFAIFVGRIIRDPEELKNSLKELGAVNGASAYIVREDKTAPRSIAPQVAVQLVEVAPATEQTKLVLELPRSRGGGVFRTIEIRGNEEVMLGRYDDKDPNATLIDVSPLFPRDSAPVSRRQAIFREQGGRWSIRKHPRAKASMYVNERLVNEGQEEFLNDGDTLSIGNTLASPALQFIIRVQN